MMQETGMTPLFFLLRCHVLITVISLFREVPEILRSNLSNVILYLKTLGIRDVLGFDFMEPPDPEQIAEALTELHVLGAIDETGVVTDDGRLMSAFPVEPAVARMLVTAAQK
jgi:pre-mRNA-splicing factor ATP-dependent RNA helicase DHX38/PRP16